MRLARLLRRRPVLGPPLPAIACGARRSYPWWHECDRPFGHTGQHGRIIGTSSHVGPLVVVICQRCFHPTRDHRRPGWLWALLGRWACRHRYATPPAGTTVPCACDGWRGDT